jgi:hypothetical protein
MRNPWRAEATDGSWTDIHEIIKDAEFWGEDERWIQSACSARGRPVSPGVALSPHPPVPHSDVVPATNDPDDQLPIAKSPPNSDRTIDFAARQSLRQDIAVSGGRKR